MGTATNHDGRGAPDEGAGTVDVRAIGPGGGSAARRRPPVVDALVCRALARDVEAESRDARARAVADELAQDPSARTATEVAALAAADRAAAAADRDAAAEDRDTLLRLLLGQRVGATADEPPPALTGRETQVLERLARAMTTRAIAEDLYLSPNSVKTHTQSVFRKIGVRSRSEAALWARDHGMG